MTTDFKLWLEAQMEAIDAELSLEVSKSDTLRSNSLREQWAQYRAAWCVHLEFEEGLNAQST